VCGKAIEIVAGGHYMKGLEESQLNDDYEWGFLTAIEKFRTMQLL